MIYRELVSTFIRRHFTLSLIIGLISGALFFFLAVIFPAVNIEKAESISSSWPPIMKDLFGDPIDAFTNIYGWLHLEVYHITFWLIFGVLAAILASHIIAREIEGKTIDILLSTPVSRNEVILSRIVGMVALLFIAIVPTVLGCGAGVALLGYPVDWGRLFFVSGGGFLLSLNFSAVTLVFSVWIPRQILSIFISLSLFGFWFLFEESLIKLIPFMGKLSFLSPFHFYRPENILIRSDYSLEGAVFLLLIFVALTAVSSLCFARKDIPA